MFVCLLQLSYSYRQLYVLCVGGSRLLVPRLLDHKKPHWDLLTTLSYTGLYVALLGRVLCVWEEGCTWIYRRPKREVVPGLQDNSFSSTKMKFPTLPLLASVLRVE